jgi:hypothetical protein
VALLSPISGLIATITSVFLVFLANGAYLNEVAAMELLLREATELVAGCRK